MSRWKASGCSNRQIAARLGVNENAVRKVLRRLGELALARLGLALAERRIARGVARFLGTNLTIRYAVAPAGKSRADRY